MTQAPSDTDLARLKEAAERATPDLSVAPFADNGVGWLMYRAANAYREEYVFSLEDGPDHDPTEFEGWMLEDFFAGLISDERFFGPVRYLLAKVETLTRERDEASAQLASVHEEYALCRKLLMERVEDLDAAHDRAEALEKGLESLINAAPTLIVKAVRAPPDAEGLEDWSAAIGYARALLQPTERGDG